MSELAGFSRNLPFNFIRSVSENSTTTSPTTPAGETNPWDMMSSQQLVLSATGGSGSRVTLACKQPGARDQLWRLTPEGHLQHEGSSPPSLYPASSDKVLVLDIVGPAPQPTQYVALSLRRPDPRRKTTQTWQFTPDGRLSCAHHNMCVQAMDGFLGLRPGIFPSFYLSNPVNSRLSAVFLSFFFRQ